MKKFLCVAIVAIVCGLSGCKDYDSDITEINNRLDEIENTQIKTIQQQITAINTSLQKLEKTDADLKDYITALQNRAEELADEITVTNNKINGLKNSLEGQITSETTRIIGLLEATKSDIQSELTTINGLITDLKDKDKELEDKIEELKVRMSAIERATLSFSTTESNLVCCVPISFRGRLP